MRESADDNRNRQLEADVRSRLDKDDDRHVRALARYEVKVAAGCATLSGHVRSRDVARRMADVARQVRGVLEVDERLFADDEIEVQVASAIGRTEVNRGSRLIVRAEFGHLRVGGVFASNAAQADAERVGAGVTGVVTVSGTRPSDLLG